MHGFFSVITLPVNLIVAIWVTEDANKAFSYSNKHISIKELAMFARFPQGIPQGITLDEIRR